MPRYAAGAPFGAKNVAVLSCLAHQAAEHLGR
jgi:hypothetical protein